MKRAKYNYISLLETVFYVPILSHCGCNANNISNSVIWYQILSIQLSPSTIIIPTLEEITGTILTSVFVNMSNYLIEVYTPEPCSKIISNLLLVFIESKILKYLTVLLLLSALICKKDPRTIQFFIKMCLRTSQTLNRSFQIQFIPSTG